MTPSLQTIRHPSSMKVTRRIQTFPCFSSSTSNNNNSNSNNNNTVATIIQGPALLTQTGFVRPSPTLFYLPGLRSHPFWTARSRSTNGSSSGVTVAYGEPTLTRITQLLESNYDIIRDEYMNGVMGIARNASSFTDMNKPTSRKPLESDYDVKASGGEHASTTLHVGTWDWHSYLSGGIIQPRFENIFPKTTSILRLLRTPTYQWSLFDTVLNSQQQQQPSSSSLENHNPFAYCFFSTLQGKSVIKPHSGPMNLRLRIHFPILVPKHVESYTKSTLLNHRHPSTKPTPCGIRVGDQIRSWEEGKVLIFDDSYEHEVWNDTDDVRVLLLVDVWHPDVQQEERGRISDMFQFARTKGWMR